MNESSQIHVRRVTVHGYMIWFRSVVSPPTDEEMNAWAPRYREEARQRGPRNPLIIDVEGDKLRGV
jgi:hypothetical protein